MIVNVTSVYKLNDMPGFNINVIVVGLQTDLEICSAAKHVLQFIIWNASIHLC